jgi:HAD superfamily hydrolase (TIGR01662 family)
MKKMIDLEGSIAQIKWANNIREENMQPLFEYYSSIGEEKVINIVLRRYTFAKWWIDHRENIISRMREEIEEHLLKVKYGTYKPYIQDHEQLVIFDLNGTLTNTPFIDKKPLSILPGRREKLQALKNNNRILAIACNQGGVARGHLTEEQAYSEIKPIAKELGIKVYILAFGYPDPIAGLEKYNTQDQLSLRKPNPGMPNMLLEYSKVSKDFAVMVGDAEEDAMAAKSAGIRFIWSQEFFENVN